jgi:hypothetical protein
MEENTDITGYYSKTATYGTFFCHLFFNQEAGSKGNDQMTSGHNVIKLQTILFVNR